jgi:hypothetical protein
MLLFRERRNVLDDEDFFAGFDETELAARDFFDGGRVVGEPPGLIAKTRVFSPLAGDGRLQLVVLPARLQHGEQSLIADERVEHDEGRDKQYEHVDDLAGARGALGLRGSSFRGRSLVCLRHRGTNSTPIFMLKYSWL